MRTLVLSALLGIFALAASAADVTGKWVAQIPGRGGNATETTINLKQTGNDITGTVNGGRGDQAISEGKAMGDNITFVVAFEAGGNQIKQTYTGTVSGSEIKFTRAGGRGNPIEFTAKKQ